MRLGKNESKSIAIPIRGLPGNKVRNSMSPSKLAADQVRAETDGGRLWRLTRIAIVARLNDETKKKTETRTAKSREEVFREIVMIVVV
jgi:hypothetical protein